jgi:hypothetical protein
MSHLSHVQHNSIACQLNRSLGFMVTVVLAALIVQGCSPHRSQAPREESSQVRIGNGSASGSKLPGGALNSTNRNAADTSGSRPAQHPQAEETRFAANNTLINKVGDVPLRNRLSQVWDWLHLQNQRVSLSYMQAALEWWVWFQNGEAPLGSEAYQGALLKARAESAAVVDYMVGRVRAMSRQSEEPSAGELSTTQQVVLSDAQKEVLRLRVEFFLFMLSIGESQRFYTQHASSVSSTVAQDIKTKLDKAELEVLTKLVVATNPISIDFIDRTLQLSLNDMRVAFGHSALSLDQYSRITTRREEPSIP